MDWVSFTTESQKNSQVKAVSAAQKRKPTTKQAMLYITWALPLRMWGRNIIRMCPRSRSV